MSNPDITLYHANWSLCSQMVRVALFEKGLAFKEKHIRLCDQYAEGENLDNDFLKINSVKKKSFIVAGGVAANNGIRKKVEPLINNNFIITEDQNPFTIIDNGKDFFIEFETRWDQWREKIIKLNQSELVLEHQEKRYHYVRFVKDLELWGHPRRSLNHKP